MKISKRGEETSTMAWGTIAMVVYLFFLGVVAIILIMGMLSYKNSTTGIPDSVKSRIYMSRFLIAENCLAYKEPSIERSDGFVMDWQRFQSDESIRKCYSQLESDWGFRLTLEKPDGEKMKVKTAHYEENRLPAAKLYRPVLIKDGDAVLSGELTIDIQP